MQYGCLARVVREGGFRIALIARFSAIPGHCASSFRLSEELRPLRFHFSVTTAVFATCGMPVLIFAAAAFLSLPKQFATVYIGVIIEGQGKSTFKFYFRHCLRLNYDSADETTPQRVASYSLIAVSTIVTFVAAWYIYRELNRAKPAVIYERRKARYIIPVPLFPYETQQVVLSRQAKMELSRSFYNNDSSSLSAFNPNPSDSDIPLQPYGSERDPGFEGPSHQRWDETGQAIGYAPDPRLHAPRPRAPSFSPTALYASPDAAAAVTSSINTEPEDEWSNAETPKTARPPETIIPMPVPTAPIPHLEHIPQAPGEYTHTDPPTLSFSSPQQLLHSGRTRSPPSSATSQYATYHPEHFASSPLSGSVGVGSVSAPPRFTSPVTGFESVPSHEFSPPPSYQ